MTTKLISRTLFSVLFLLFFALPASAAIVQVETADLIYEYDNSTLFGDLYITNYDENTVAFKPTEFDVQSNNLDGSVSLIDKIVVDIWVKDEANFNITKLRVVEKGDYNVGVPNGDDGVNSVRANLYTDINGVENNVFFETNVSDPNAPNPEYKIVNTHHLDGSDNHLLLYIENQLQAVNLQNGTLSFIDKKLVRIASTVVPVPAAVWLFGSVLATLGLFRKRAEATV